DNASNSRGISLANASWCQLARLVVKGVEKRAIILKASSQNNIISSGYFVDNKDIAIRVNSNCPNNSIQDNIFVAGISMNVPMIKIRSDNNIIVDNNIQDNDPQDGTFRFQDGISLSAASNNIISGNYILQAKRAGVYLENSPDNNQITANQIQDGKKQGIILKNSDMNIVGANNISGNEKNGIVIRGGSDSNVINQNIVYDNGDNNNYSGIKVIRDSDNNFISANRIYDSRGSGYGININNANCNDSYLVANYIDGPGYIDTNASTPYDRRIRDKGQGTQYTGKEKLTLERNPSVLILNGGDNIDPGTSPRTYIALKSFSNNIDAGIVNGKAAGDILILQGTDDTHTVTIKDSSSNVNLTANRILGAGDTLTLIWNGNKWLEVGFSDN
ncbi:MAG: NosD domain-containing protein, partial [Candidatus Omnitrophota bacterium]